MTVDRAYIAILGVGIAASLALAVLPYNDVTALAYPVLGALTVVVLLVGLRRRRLHRRRAWALLAAAMATSVVGDAIFVVLEVSGEPPFPSIADVAYLASYVLYAAALWVLGRRDRADNGALVDAAIVGISAAVLGWVYLLAPYVEDPDLTQLERVISLAYPVGDFVLIPLIARLVFAHAASIRAHVLVLIGMLLYLIGDVAFGLGNLAGWYDSGGLIDAAWLVAYVLFAAAVWHPSAAMKPPTLDVEVSLSSQRLAALATASVLAPIVVMLHDRSTGYAVRVAAAGSILLFLLVIQRMAGLMHQIHQQADALAALSRTDPLTGAANRRHLDEELHRALLRVERSGTNVTVGLLDLDRFKAYNDTCGHPAGDALLRDAVHAWQAELRELDLLARFGGEEFVVLLSDTPPPQAEQVIERLRAQVPHDQTCSAGIAHAVAGDSAEALIERADRALYEAKRTGRDRTVLAPAQQA